MESPTTNPKKPKKNNSHFTVVNTSDTHIELRAPAKLNLFLHVTGKRNDGYHLLESLVVFTELSDRLTIHRSLDHSTNLMIEGSFSNPIASHPTNDNLIIKTNCYLQQHHQQYQHYNYQLEKNIPIQAGLGGGSADAAAVIRGLAHFHSLPSFEDASFLRQLAHQLGADIPVCLQSKPAIMQGIGEKLLPHNTLMSGVHILLVNPGVSCPTGRIFTTLNLSQNQTSEALSLDHAQDQEELITLLCNDYQNDLETFAIGILPTIQTVLDSLKQQQGCLLSRMSGSGATCFGLFSNQQTILKAKETIERTHKDWWVCATKIL